MGKEFVPKVKREVWVGAAEPGDEVVLERSDGAFSGVATMETGWDELAVDVFGLHVIF